MDFAYNFFQGTLQTVGLGQVFSSMAKRPEAADLVMAMYKLQSNSGLSDRMTYHPTDTVGLLNLQAALLLFERAEELQRLREIKRKSPDKYRQGIDSLAMVAYLGAMKRGRELNASGSTVRQFLSQFPA